MPASHAGDSGVSTHQDRNFWTGRIVGQLRMTVNHLPFGFVGSSPTQSIKFSRIPNCAF